MEISYLANVAIRSLGLAGAAWVAMTVARVRSPAARHAVWTLVTAGMLALAGVSAVAPVLPVRVLQARRPVAMAVTAAMAPAAVARAPVAAARPFPWQAVYFAGLVLLGGRLAYGYRLTRRLVRESRALPDYSNVYESGAISVPVTVGWLRPRILLPAGWEAWEPAKLDAVLVHERSHIGRGDWAIAVMAGVNRCLFWFHPLAWWLERQLTVLAEQACDDASLGQPVSREYYAQVLVEMAAAVRRGEGRVGWEAMAMAKSAEVRMRVERILDESRQIFPAMTKARWAAMALCAAPLIYLAAVARPARALAPQTPPPPAAAAPQTQTAPLKLARTGGPEAAANEREAAQRELEALGAELAKFRAENMRRLPEQMSVNVDGLRAAQAQLAAAQEALNRDQREKLLLETQLQNLDNQRRYYDSVAADAVHQAKVRQVEQQLQDAQSRLAASLDQLRPEHPAIKRMQASLASLEQELEALRNESRPENRKMVLDLEGSINMAKANIQNLNLQMDEKVRQLELLQQQIASYQSRIESAPRLEQQYMQLLRSYESAKQRMSDLPADGPSLISRREPEYTPEARSAGIEGKVELSVTIGTDGAARDIQVVHGLDPGLDKKAIECVQGWRFRPAMRDGAPVTAFASVEVLFRLR